MATVAWALLIVLDLDHHDLSTRTVDHFGVYLLFLESNLFDLVVCLCLFHVVERAVRAHAHVDRFVELTRTIAKYFPVLGLLHVSNHDVPQALEHKFHSLFAVLTFVVQHGRLLDAAAEDLLVIEQTGLAHNDAHGVFGRG